MPAFAAELGATDQKEFSMMRKALCSIAAATVLALAFAGCSTSTDPGSDPTPPAQKFTVTFNVNGADEDIADQTVVKGALVVKPSPDPVKEGTEFELWALSSDPEVDYDFSTPVTANFGLVAIWKDEPRPVAEFTISFEPGAVSNATSMPDPAQVKKGSALTKPSEVPEDPSKVKEFDFWGLNDAATAEYDFTTPVTEDFTLYAIWKDAVVNYTVTFEPGEVANAENMPTTATVKEGDTVTEPEAPTDPSGDMTFVVWNDKATDDAYDFSTKVSGNLTLVATWEATTGK